MESLKHIQKKTMLQKLLTLMKTEKCWVRWISQNGKKSKVKKAVESKENTVLSNGLLDGEEKINRSQSGELISTLDADMFKIVTTEEGSFIALGSNRLTDYRSEKMCKIMVETRDYQLLFNLIAVTAEAIVKTYLDNEKNNVNLESKSEGNT